MYMLSGAQRAVENTLSEHLVVRLLCGKACQREPAAGAAAAVQSSMAVCVDLRAALAQLLNCSAVVGLWGWVFFVACSLSGVERCKCCVVFVCWVFSVLLDCSSAAACACWLRCWSCAQHVQQRRALLRAELLVECICTDV